MYMINIIIDYIKIIIETIMIKITSEFLKLEITVAEGFNL